MTDHAAFIRANTAIGAAAGAGDPTYLASEVTPLWHATEASLAQSQLPPPYWAFAWPGGQALARYLLDHPETVRDKIVMDFGAGCGLAAIAAAKAGAAEVIAAEIDPFAAAVIALNAALNGVEIAAETRDFLVTFPDIPDSSGDESMIFPSVSDVILVGDMCYERKLAERLLDFLRARAAIGAEILLGDPGRAYLPRNGLEAMAQYDVPTSLDLEDREARHTTLYRWRA